VYALFMTDWAQNADALDNNFKKNFLIFKAHRAGIVLLSCDRDLKAGKRK